MPRPFRVTGNLPALVTPVDAEGRVLGAEVDRLVRRALADGASGVLVAGSTGEGTLLEPPQRVELVDAARTALDGARTSPSPLLACASAPTMGGLLEDVRRLGEAGADAVLVLAPSTQPLRPEELLTVHRDAAAASPVPTLAYHIPQLTGSSLTPESVRELAALPNVVGMKDSSPDAERRAAFRAATRGVEGFSLLTGHAPSLRAALEAGVDGSILAIANVRQRQAVALHRAVADGDGVTAERLQAGLTRTMTAVLEAGASVPAVLKAALQLDGVLEERWCRPPLASIPPARLDRVRTALLH